MNRNSENKGKGRGYFQKNKYKIDKYEYLKDPKKCEYCEEILPYEKKRGKFCNHSCSSSYNNQGIVRNGDGKNGKRKCDLKQKNNCINCEGLTINVKYCSALCRSQYEKKIVVEAIEITGILPTDISGGIKIGAKRYLIEKRGRACEHCKNNEWMGVPIPIEFHHKNGNPDDNKETNIQILCSNCHAITLTHRGRNKNGNGRWSKKNKVRRQRYAQGLST